MCTCMCKHEFCVERIVQIQKAELVEIGLTAIKLNLYSAKPHSDHQIDNYQWDTSFDNYRLDVPSTMRRWHGQRIDRENESIIRGSDDTVSTNPLFVLMLWRIQDGIN